VSRIRFVRSLIAEGLTLSAVAYGRLPVRMVGLARGGNPPDACGRARVARADGRAPIAALRSLDSHLASEQAPFWMLALLLTLFAGGSQLVAAIGQYAVAAFEGRRRLREFGLRIALRASAQQVVRSVLRESFRLRASRPGDHESTSSA
jgi:hypothetical protein